MDRHEPTVPTNSNKVNSEASAARRLVNGVGNFLKDNKNKLTATATAGVLAITLAGCGANASAEGPQPTTSQSANPNSSPSATKSPETQAPSNEHKFSGTINYDALVGPAFSELIPPEQQKVCSDFFSENIENEPVMTALSTGVEVTTWYNNRLLVLEDLALDKSDDRNFEAAINIASCLTSEPVVNGEDSPGRSFIKEQVTSLNKSSLDGVFMNYIPEDQITRYSDGTFMARTQNGANYLALSVEGHDNNGLGNNPGQLAVNYFEWAPNESTYRLVVRTPAEDQGVNPYFGADKPPVVLDQSRANAPNQLD